jgi:hypothetical protein
MRCMVQCFQGCCLLLASKLPMAHMKTVRIHIGGSAAVSYVSALLAIAGVNRWHPQQMQYMQSDGSVAKGSHSDIICYAYASTAP